MCCCRGYALGNACKLAYALCTLFFLAAFFLQMLPGVSLIHPSCLLDDVMPLQPSYRQGPARTCPNSR
ncbi:hypothetical protein Y1Q_0009990 [Alligator mississippiensis]|uniref:Uncharacterized protein n=1 Tax=Alligator mississippiensis TaxID=8496 RepID=A0A151MLJ9_ALLMI|nr:hypothetical protein Y1Q_0009990 [Alligator mississippiensis]